MLSKGEYDEYSVKGLYICLKDFCIGEKFLEWARDTNKFVQEDLSVEFDARKDKEPNLVEWLIGKGFIKEIKYTEIHLGDPDYGEYALTNISDIK